MYLTWRCAVCLELLVIRSNRQLRFSNNRGQMLEMSVSIVGLGGGINTGKRLLPRRGLAVVGPVRKPQAPTQRLAHGDRVFSRRGSVLVLCSGAGHFKDAVW